MESLTLGFETQESSTDFTPLGRKQHATPRRHLTFKMEGVKVKDFPRNHECSLLSILMLSSWSIICFSAGARALSRVPDPDSIRTFWLVCGSGYHSFYTQAFHFFYFFSSSLFISDCVFNLCSNLVHCTVTQSYHEAGHLWWFLPLYTRLAQS